MPIAILSRDNISLILPEINSIINLIMNEINKKHSPTSILSKDKPDFNSLDKVLIILLFTVRTMKP